MRWASGVKSRSPSRTARRVPRRRVPGPPRQGRWRCCAGRAAGRRRPRPAPGRSSAGSRRRRGRPGCRRRRRVGRAGRAEGEADRPAALLDVRLAHQVLGGLVGHVVDAGDPIALVHAALVGGVRLHGAVPVEVVRREVEHHGGVGAQRGCPVQLVAGEFDGEDVVLLLAEDRVEQGDTDVADRGRAQARRLQDGGEHLDGGGLAVGAGDGEPGSGLPAVQVLSRQASSTSPQTGTPAASAAANSGLPGCQPGAVTTRSVPSGRVAPSPRRTVTPSASSSAACAGPGRRRRR